ncbi:MAG: TIGR03016 family PEP-CTERM system-associated outer membrane protein [Pseudomonadota bacterium]
MTITTAKLTRAIALAYARPLALPLALAALLLAPAARADWTFKPTLDLRETYTDNVALQDEAHAKGQFVSEFTPGFVLKHKGPRLMLNARYQLQYFALQDHDVSGTNRTARALHAEAKGELIDDFLYFDARANRAQQNISPFGQVIADNNFSSANRTEVQSWRVSPYLKHRFDSLATLEVRYARDAVDAGHVGLGNSDGHTTSVKLNSGTAFRKLSWDMQLSGQTIHDSIANDSLIKTFDAKLRYKIVPTVTLTTGVGYDHYDYTALGGNTTSGTAWHVGASWNPSRRSSLTAVLGHRYYGPSRALKALHRSRHTAWNLNYDDAVVTTRANFLLPSTIDTAALLDDLFTPSIPDPAERQRAVEAYMLAAHLPPSLADNINYFSNRYSLQKQLRASVAFREGRTSTIFSVYRVRRNALSVREIDSPLLGNNVDTIQDNTLQTGFSAQWNYRINGRTSLNLVSDMFENESLSAGLKTHSSAVRFGARHQLRAKVSAGLELRRIEGAVLGGRIYTENAVAASLSMQL